MANLNKVLLLGNLTRDPELRYTPKGTAVGDMSLAINRVWNDERGQRQEETTFVEITMWGRQAELAQQFLSKGRGVFIEGRLQMDTWEDKATGQKRSKLKVVAENLQFMPDTKGGNGAAPSSPALPPPGTSTHYTPRVPANAPTSAMNDSLDEDDDIPF
jgi:single-strand DNA-binding protein